MYLSDFQAINIFALAKNINFDSEIEQKVSVSWSETSGVTVTYCVVAEKKYVILEYGYAGRPYRQVVALTSLPANIKPGNVYYFVCTETRTRAIKLHFIRGRFCHRSAEAEYVYELQKLGRRRRAQLKKANARRKFLTDNPMDRLYRHHHPLTYRGNPTRRVLALNNVNSV